MHDCIEWTGARSKDGYGNLRLKETGKHVKAHRLAMARIYGWEAIEGFVVMHLCDNPPCVNPAHLRVRTQKDNMSDMVAKGRQKPPAEHGTRSRYNNYRCRCDACCSAESSYQRARQKSK